MRRLLCGLRWPHALFLVCGWLQKLWDGCAHMLLRNRYVSLLEEMRKSSVHQAEATQSAVALLKGELDEAHTQLREAKATVVALEARASADRAHLDWMKLIVNQLQQERAVLMQRATGLQFPYPQLHERVVEEEPLNMFEHQENTAGKEIATPADPAMSALLGNRPLNMFEHTAEGYTE